MSLRGIGSSSGPSRNETRTQNRDFGTSSQKSQAPERESLTRVGDNTFAGGVRKEALNRVFDKAQAGGEHLTNSFGVGSQAPQLVENSVSQRLPGNSLTTDVAPAYVANENSGQIDPAVVQRSGYYGLTGEQQAAVRADMARFGATESYRASDLTAQGRARITQLVFNVSVYSQQNPELTSVRNSLDKVLSGELPLGTYNEPGRGTARVSDGRFEINLTEQDGINFDRDGHSIAQQANIFVHEVNHFLNGVTMHGTPDRFLDEYRAYIVGQEAGGEPLSEDVQRIALDQMFQNSNYAHLQQLRSNDQRFDRVIDSLYADLDGRPPVLTTPEEVRQRLFDAGISSHYIRTAGNIDNH